MDIIASALIYYDKNVEKNRRIINSEALISFNKDTNIEFYTNNELTLKAKYQVMASLKNNVWKWAWADKTLIPSIKQKSIEILTYGINTDDQRVKEETITSMFTITDPIQLDIHTSIGSYITKTEIIYVYELDNVKYFLFIEDEAY